MVSPTQPHEEFIGTVDIGQLRQLRWPILRCLAPRFVEACELDQYMRGLLASERWTSVRVTPRATPTGASPHVFEVYGRSSWSSDET
jgi:hypothetical protein